MTLSNPAKNKAIASAKVKTDKIDSITLANLLRGGWAAECYVPSKETMEFRELVRFRANLVMESTRLKNRVHAYLLQNNISIGNASPFTKTFLEKLRTIDDVRVKSYLRLIDGLNREIREASRTIQEKAGSNEDAKLLMTIPGISFYSALLIVSEIGEIGRFEDSSSLVGYAGLAPSTHSSGGKPYHGPIKIRERVPEMDNGAVHEDPHEDGTRRHGSQLLCEDSQEEREPESDCSRVGETAQDSLLGPQGEEGVSRLRGAAAAIIMRARASNR